MLPPIRCRLRNKKFSSTPPFSRLRQRPTITSLNWIKKCACIFHDFLRILIVRPVACHFQLSRYPVLVSLERRTQVPKAYAFIGAVTLFTFLHFVNALAAPASNLIGWGLPAYLSFKALESPGHDDDAQWLTYWIIFGFFNFAEGFALRALLYYFPWYFSFKTLFILWLQLPAFRVSAADLSSHKVPG